MRRAQKSSVMPILAVGYSLHSNEGEVTEKLWLSNRGLGPAFIEKVAIVDNGERLDTDPYGFLYQAQHLAGESLTFNRLYKGRIIPANEGITLCEKATDSTSTVVLGNTFEFPYDIKGMPADDASKAVIEITYKSIYGDQWIVRSDRATPIEL